MSVDDLFKIWAVTFEIEPSKVLSGEPVELGSSLFVDANVVH